jgi:hypothetical protein
MNIDPDTMVSARSFDSLRELFAKIGYDFPDELFDILSKTVACAPGMATISDFREILNEYLAMRDIGQDSEWLEQRAQCIS